jgi:hypothetical protein
LNYGKSSNVAKGGFFVALIIIILYSSTFLKFNTLFLLGVASAVIPLSVVTTNINNSLVVFIASSLLSYFLIPDKSIWMLFSLLFGPYGIIKYFLERLKNVPLEIILKLIYFNLLSYISFYFYKNFFVPNFQFQYNILLIILALQFAFYVFDYALTVFISTISRYNLK